MLHTGRSEFPGLSHSRPPRRRLWWTPPQLTDRWRGKGNALEGNHAIGFDSLQLTAKHQVATPVNWKPGEEVIIAGSVSDDEAKRRYPQGWKAPKPYIRIVPQPQ